MTTLTALEETGLGNENEEGEGGEDDDSYYPRSIECADSAKWANALESLAVRSRLLARVHSCHAHLIEVYPLRTTRRLHGSSFPSRGSLILFLHGSHALAPPFVQIKSSLY
jgi:hypothetical protein